MHKDLTMEFKYPVYIFHLDKYWLFRTQQMAEALDAGRVKKSL